MLLAVWPTGVGCGSSSPTFSFVPLNAVEFHRSRSFPVRRRSFLAIGRLLWPSVGILPRPSRGALLQDLLSSPLLIRLQDGVSALSKEHQGHPGGVQAHTNGIAGTSGVSVTQNYEV